MIGDNVTKKKEEREYAKNREEYFREFHRVIAPVVVLKSYDYKRKYDDDLKMAIHFCLVEKVQAFHKKFIK